MKSLALIFVSCIFLQAEGLSFPHFNVPSIKLPTLSPNDFAIQAFKKVLKGKPSCSFQGESGSCCIVVNLPHLNKKFDNCVTFTMKQEKVNIGLSVNGKEIIQKDVDSKFTTPCYPIPSVPLTVCMDVYHFEANSNEKSFNTCVRVALKPIVSNIQLVDLNFGCFKFQDGKLKRNDDFSPETTGLLNVDFIEGKKPKIAIDIPNPFKKKE